MEVDSGIARLPTSPRPLVGRAGEGVEAGRLLLDDSTRLLTLTDPVASGRRGSAWPSLAVSNGPSPRARAVVDALRRARCGAAPTAEAGAADERRCDPVTGDHLPTATRPAIGRTRDVEALGELVRAKDSRLVTLVGPGGVGKTRLAVALIDSVRVAFDERVRFVDLVAVREAGLVLARIAEAFDVRESPAAGRSRWR